MSPRSLGTLSLALCLSLFADGAPAQEKAAPANPALDRLKALAGDWVDANAKPDKKDEVVARFHVTANGSAVVETLLPGTPHEMMNVYHADGPDIVMTHYCAGGNQPRMRAKKTAGERIELLFDGGTNFDPKKDDHMHSLTITFMGPDEMVAEWISFKAGVQEPGTTKFHHRRKKS